ncbi:hypothetical protein NIES25_18160 [Nostoc linckia NIES-25]|nr:hypothetical protein NIES25_18160 [Nostoc linckia NIES-25]
MCDRFLWISKAQKVRRLVNWAWGIGQGARERGMVRQAHQPGKREKIKFIPFPFSL